MFYIDGRKTISPELINYFCPAVLFVSLQDCFAVLFTSFQDGSATLRRFVRFYPGIIPFSELRRNGGFKQPRRLNRGAGSIPAGWNRRDGTAVAAFERSFVYIYIDIYIYTKRINVKI